MVAWPRVVVARIIRRQDDRGDAADPGVTHTRPAADDSHPRGFGSVNWLIPGNMPRVSVFMPTYHQAAFPSRAVVDLLGRSVSHQEPTAAREAADPEAAVARSSGR